MRNYHSILSNYLLTFTFLTQGVYYNILKYHYENKQVNIQNINTFINLF